MYPVHARLASQVELGEEEHRRICVVKVWCEGAACRETGDKWQAAKSVLGLLDLVQGPVEPSASVHILAPGPDFLDVGCTFLIPDNMLSLRRTET